MQCANVCVALRPNYRRASRAHAGRPAQGREGLEAYGHSRSMATGTGPDVRKCRGSQACRAGNTCNQALQSEHTCRQAQGGTRGGRGGWVDPGDEASGGSAQDMSGQGSTGGRRRVDQPERGAGWHRPTSCRLATVRTWGPRLVAEIGLTWCLHMR